MKSKRILVALAAASAFAGAAPAVSSAESSGGPVAHAACTRTSVEGQSRCVAAGQFCRHTSRAESAYRRVGLSCSRRDANGRYHLRYT